MRTLVLLVLVLAGCTGDPTTTAPPAHAEGKFNIVPPGSHEVNFEMEEGGHVRFVFNATYAVSWDLHSHRGQGVDTWQEGNGVDATIDFVAPATNTYSVWIRATGPITTSVEYRMDGAFEPVE